MLRRAQEERQEWLPRAADTEGLEHDNLEEQEVEVAPSIKTTSLLLGSTVWRPSVLHVVW